MDLDDPGKPLPTDASAEDRSAATSARERLEVARLVNRQRHVWRVLSIVAASVVLLLLAVMLRRDQIARDSAIQEISVVAKAFENWVNMHYGFPPTLKMAIGDRLQNVEEMYEYADAPRLDLVRQGNEAVVIVASRSPITLALGQNGRTVVLCRRRAFQVSFQAKWMTEQEFANQRRLEETWIAQSRSTPPIKTGTDQAGEHE